VNQMRRSVLSESSRRPFGTILTMRQKKTGSATMDHARCHQIRTGVMVLVVERLRCGSRNVTW
jgi:hypothetical protein